MVRAARLLLIVVFSVLLAVGSGCRSKEAPKAEPKVAPPAIAKAGTLRAGVDFSYPPYAGKDGQQSAGIDLDVAAAIAERLGLTVEYVDVAPSEVTSALAEGRVDVALSVPIASIDLERVTSAGAYIEDGPAVFGLASKDPATETSITLETIPVEEIAVQERSASHWLLRSELGSDTIKPFDTLREALEAVRDGKHRYAVGDAVVGAYIARDIPEIRFAGQLVPASPYAVVVKAENTTLSESVRGVLDELAADGVLDSIRRKWVGELPELQGASAEESESDTAPE